MMDVLIIEPSRELSAVISEAFARKEISARTAQSAQAGIKLADEKTPRVVILELLLPKHNGLEFIHEFRSYPEWLGVPVIIYSHLSEQELGLDKAVMSELGIKNHFYKPTASLQDLVASVEEVLV